jgi:hypothetical protein
MKKLLGILVLGLLFGGSAFSLNLDRVKSEFPKNRFENSIISLNEIISGGPPRDGIPPIDNPKFLKKNDKIGLEEPVIFLEINNEAKIYPIRVLTWHEIVNDEIGGVPVTVTFCPLCNASIVFDRRFDEEVLDFGTSGRLRNSDLIMYDRQTETFWQQFTGQGLVGEYAGLKLKKIPSLIISYEEALRIINEKGYQTQILKGPEVRPYGDNPYVGYDKSGFPFLYNGSLPKDINPMDYVIVVNDKAYSLTLIQKMKKLEIDDIVITWQEGLNSALEDTKISDGRDLGFVRVQRKENNQLIDIIYDYTFAFVYHAFHEGKKIIQDPSP